MLGKANNNSYDFPFPTKYTRINKNNKLLHINKSSSFINPSREAKNIFYNCYTNEANDFFRLYNLQEKDRGKYHNKYLDDIKSINRNENFISYHSNRDKILLLDSIKSNYNLSQKPENYNEIIFGNNNIESKNENKKEELNLDNNNNVHILSKDKIDFLNRNYVERTIPIKLKKSLSSNQYNSIDNKNDYYSKNFSPLYFMNINDYNIKEADNEDIEKQFYINKKKEYKVHNTITNKDYTINTDNKISIPKWSPFYEKYLDRLDKGFKRQGGYFSEFVKNHYNEYNDMQKRVDERRDILKQKTHTHSSTII